MKIVEKNKSESSEIKYPFIGVAPRGVVVIFAAYGCGFPLLMEGKVWEFPEKLEIQLCWNNWDMSQFTPYGGTIELSND